MNIDEAFAAVFSNQREMVKEIERLKSCVSSCEAQLGDLHSVINQLATQVGAMVPGSIAEAVAGAREKVFNGPNTIEVFAIGEEDEGDRS